VVFNERKKQKKLHNNLYADLGRKQGNKESRGNEAIFTMFS